MNTNAGGERRHHNRSYQQGVAAANRRGQSITADNRMMTKDGTMSNAAYNMKVSTGAAANSSSNITAGHNYKKGVKFQKKKGYNIEDEAVTIVDDAIKRALDLFYGKKTSSARMGSSSRKHSSSSAASRKSSAASTSAFGSGRLTEQQRNKVSKRTNNFIRDFKTENIYRESIVKGLSKGQRSMTLGGGIRKHSIKPVTGVGRSSEGNAPPPSVQTPGPLVPGGFYELDITPYGSKNRENETREQQQRQRRYSEGTPSRFKVGSSSHQSFTLPPLQPTTTPGQSIQTSTSQLSSSLQVNQDQTNYAQYNHKYANGNQPFTSGVAKTGVSPPTITKGNVTRVRHELNDQTFTQPAPGEVFQSSRSMDEMDGEYSTVPLPLTKNPPQISAQYGVTNFTPSMLENVKLDATRNHYVSLPGAVSTRQGLGMQQPQNLSATWDMYQSGPGYRYSSHTLCPENTYSIGVNRKGKVNQLGQKQYLYPDPLERPASTPAVFHGHNMYSPPVSTAGMYGAYATMPYSIPPVGYNHQRFYQNHYGSAENLGQDTQQPPLDFHFQLQPNQNGSRRVQSYSNITSPSSPPVRTGHYGSRNDLLEYSAYSNEPIIVADLMDKKHNITNGTIRVDRYKENSPGTSSTQHARFYSSTRGDSPAVNMRKQQTLNFFVFGDRSQSETNLRTANYDIEPRHVEDYIDVSGFYYDRERQRYYDDQVDYYDVMSDQDGCETRSEPDYNLKRTREKVIHHKQTQTLSTPGKEKKTPVMKKIEKKEIQAYRQFPPKRFPPQVHHKETTHYITKRKAN